MQKELRAKRIFHNLERALTQGNRGRALLGEADLCISQEFHKSAFFILLGVQTVQVTKDLVSVKEINLWSLQRIQKIHFLKTKKPGESQ